MNKLIVGNLVHRPLRSVISALAVAIEVVMILSIVGIFYGILNGSKAQQSGTGMDMIVRPGAANALLSSSSASADVRVADVLRKMPHVQVVAPVNIKLTLGSSVENIYGIDFPTYNALRPFVFVAGGPFTEPYQIIVDDLQAAGNPTLTVGSRVKVLNHEFTVCGIVEHGKGARKFIPLETMDILDGNPGKAATVLPPHRRRLHPGRQVRHPGDRPQRDSLHRRPSGLEHSDHRRVPRRTHPGAYARLQDRPRCRDRRGHHHRLPGHLPVHVHRRHGAHPRDRHPQVARAPAASPSSRWYCAKPACSPSSASSSACSSPTRCATVCTCASPPSASSSPPEWDIKAVIIAICGSLFGALYPALKAARKDPIDALSYD